ncbi:MAG: hypothetical protein BIFFINMI_03545 [Phycisphaerae bacterium]|nr:hypothetical protein [Phycisphaerae bacterium]
MSKHTARHPVLKTVILALAATALLAPLAGDACDDPVFVVARTQWQREYFALVAAWQPGNFDPAAWDARIAEASKPLDEGGFLNVEINLVPTAFNMSLPSFNRQLLDQMGLSGYPLVVMLDGKGKPMTLSEAPDPDAGSYYRPREVPARFASLAEARDRLTPLKEGELPAFGAPSKLALDPQHMPARIVIIYDKELKANDPDHPKADPTPTETLAREWAKALAASPLALLNVATLVDVRQPGENADLIAQLQLKLLPWIALVNQDQETVATLAGIPSVDELKRICFSPIRDKVATTLLGPRSDEPEQMTVTATPGQEPPDAAAGPQGASGPDGEGVFGAEPGVADPNAPRAGEGEVALVFLLVRGTDAQATDAMRKACAAVGADAEKNLHVKVPTIELDPRDVREEYLLKQIDRDPKAANPTLVPIMGMGRALNVINKPVDENDLWDFVQMVFQNCACTMQPRDFGRDLLMARGGPNGGNVAWTPFGAPEDAATASAGWRLSHWLLFGTVAMLGLLLTGGLVMWARSGSNGRTNGNGGNGHGH